MKTRKEILRMYGNGLIRDSIDLKVLILYILSKLPEDVPEITLCDLVMRHAESLYFEYTECLDKLIETEHISTSADGLSITEKGRKNVTTIESTLAYTVRQSADKNAAKIAASIRRKNSISASHTEDENGCTVALSLSDGISPVMELKLICADVQQAESIENSFKKDAEVIFNKVLETLLGEGKA